MNELEKLGIDLKGKTYGEFKTICPKCSNSRKKQHDPCLSVNITTGVYHCFNCEWKGTTMKRQIEKKEYTLPTENLTGLSENALGWFKKRGIGQSTLMSLKVSEGPEYMPQESKEMNCIQFNYYEDDQLVNIKYRDAKKNFKQFKGGKPVFYNLKAFSFDEVIITEGEIDCMSFYEAGMLNVVSVPAGATDSETATLEYLNTCYDYLQGKKFIIATDNDEKGIGFRNVLASRLGKEFCRYIEFPEAIKDANDLLISVGAERFKSSLNIKQFPLEGIETVEDVESSIDHIYMHGYPSGITLGFTNFDTLLSWFTGQVSVITGIPGHGKSEFLDQIMITLSEKHKWKHGVFSAENQPISQHLVKLFEKYTKKSMFGHYKMTDDEYSYAKLFVNEHFFFIKFNEINLAIDQILQRGKELVTRHGIKLLAIDNWANLDHNYAGMNEHQYIGQSLIKIMNFAKMYDCHVVLVAHPTKIYKDKETGLHEIPNLYNISGSSHFFNKVDNGLTVYRNMKTGETEVHIQKVRWKFTGKVGSAVFAWNQENGVYKELF